jgi:hypothetical protein
VAAFQFWSASQYTIFDDEAFSCLRYTMPLGEMIPALYHGIEPDPPLYYIIQNLWVHQFGVEPWALRSLSILLFLTGLLVMRAAARVWFNEQIARATFLICALHPAHLFFGFAARWYSAMFLMVALLMWITGRMRQTEVRNPNFLWIAWSLIAAAVCYTNYFGVVVVGLTWLAGIIPPQSSTASAPRTQLRHWLLAGFGAAALYAFWIPAFWSTLRTFPPTGGKIISYAATAGRTLTALATGNLASPDAWWIWTLIIIYAVCMTYRLLRIWNKVWPLPLIVVGCLAAGIASRTMIDKYTLTFSGPTCMLVAALLVIDKRGAIAALPPSTRPLHWVGFSRRLAIACLSLAWLGCAINLVSEKNWSSIRWLDPFTKVVQDAVATRIPCSHWVATHPSARYYAAKDAARITPAGTRHVTSAVEWRTYAAQPTESHPNAVATPSSMIRRLIIAPPDRLITIEAAGFAESPDWKVLRRRLTRDYKMVSEHLYLEDPDAALKDLVDPLYHHPTWRIEMRVWEKPRS